MCLNYPGCTCQSLREYVQLSFDKFIGFDNASGVDERTSSQGYKLFHLNQNSIHLSVIAVTDCTSQQPQCKMHLPHLLPSPQEEVSLCLLFPSSTVLSCVCQPSQPICSLHHSECAVCSRIEISCLASLVAAVSMRTVKARYEEDIIRCTAVTILAGCLCSADSPASCDSAQVHKSDETPVSTALQLCSGGASHCPTCKVKHVQTKPTANELCSMLHSDMTETY